jgi:hypothetical protein
MKFKVYYNSHEGPKIVPEPNHPSHTLSLKFVLILLRLGLSGDFNICHSYYMTAVILILHLIIVIICDKEYK